MTRAFSGEKLQFCHKLLSEERPASFQKTLISQLLLPPAMLIFQIKWTALTEICFLKFQYQVAEIFIKILEDETVYLYAHIFIFSSNYHTVLSIKIRTRAVLVCIL